MKQIIDAIDSWQARIATGLAMLGALALFLAPGSEWKFELKTFVPFAVAFSAWLFANLKGAGRVVHPHDVRLFEKLMELVDGDERRFLRQNDFLNDFSLDRLKGIREIYVTWDGAGFQFLDKKTQAQWAPLKTAIDELAGLIALNTAPVRGNVRLQTVRTARDRDDWEISDRAREEARELNAAATSITEKLDAFEPFARSRLGV